MLATAMPPMHFERVNHNEEITAKKKAPETLPRKPFSTCCNVRIPLP
jgi:hypothetical protein